MSFYRPGSVWDLSRVGLDTYEGVEAIRGFFADWIGSFEELEVEIEEIQDLGGGVIPAVIQIRGRPVGGSGRVELRYASVTEWPTA
jgi:hypothetical protein